MQVPMEMFDAKEVLPLDSGNYLVYQEGTDSIAYFCSEQQQFSIDGVLLKHELLYWTHLQVR